jgi:hypothetical protein
LNTISAAVDTLARDRHHSPKRLVISFALTLGLVMIAMIALRSQLQQPVGAIRGLDGPTSSARSAPRL